VRLGPLVDAAWLADHLDDADLVVVDVRWYLDGRSGRDAYDTGHIPGSVFVDLDSVLSSAPSPAGGRHPLPDPDRFAADLGRLGIGDAIRVVAYDDTGGITAGRLWWMLDALGRDVAVLDGGIDSWVGALSTVPVERPAATFTPAPWPANRIISSDELDAALGGNLVILDARSPDRYAHGGPVDPRPGHVPGARSAPATDNLADGRLRPTGELAERYSSLGADERSVVAYCGSGVSACIDLLALRLAGMPDGRLFVGSWSAWGADENRPAEEGSDRA
jgi:thiosulfate/3-mercaptopyruvate sulfurtransferase